MDQENPPVPRLLAVLAAWAWRLIVIGVAVYFLARIVSLLSLVAIPVIVALLLTALLKPLADALRRRRVPRLGATWLSVLTGVVVIVGLGYLAGFLFADRWEEISAEARRTEERLRAFLADGPLALDREELARLGASLLDWLRGHQEGLTGAVARGTVVTAQVLTGLVLAFFVAFFLIHDGERIWAGTVRLFPSRLRDRVARAGSMAWTVLSGFIRGALVIAIVHALIILVTLLLLGVPLAGPLAILVFIGSFIPYAGALVSGAVAVVVSLVTSGPVAALIVLAVLIGQNQLENVVLEPVVMKHYVRLHPMVIGLAVVVGTIIWGIPGALVAVPATAMAVRALPLLSADRPPPPSPRTARPGPAPEGRAEPPPAGRPG